MTVALMGGTFNPIHYGHLRVAEEVREALSLKKAIFVPACLPPHKEDGELAPSQKRLEMTELAISDNPGFMVSDIEIKRQGRSYTIDTVRELSKGGDNVAVITGSDQFNEISTWCDYEELFRIADFVIVSRPGYPSKKIGEALPVELARKFWYDKDESTYMNSFGHRITYVPTTLMDISSSEIRHRIKEGLSVKYLVPPCVEDYMRKNGLYL